MHCVTGPGGWTYARTSEERNIITYKLNYNLLKLKLAIIKISYNITLRRVYRQEDSLAIKSSEKY